MRHWPPGWTYGPTAVGVNWGVEPSLRRSTKSGRCSELEPRVGVEPTTYCLQTGEAGVIHTVLRISLGRAVKLGKVARNVAASSTRLRRNGMRFDLNAGTLTVRHTLQAQLRELGQPKTERSRRTPQLPGITLSALTEQRKRQAADGIVSHFVFASPAGSPLDDRNVSRAFHNALERAQLPHQRFHDLRHGFATLMIESGEELATVSRLLGHSGIGTTPHHPINGAKGRGSHGCDLEPNGMKTRFGYERGYSPRQALIQRCRESPHRAQNGGAPGGIRTPDLLIRSRRGLNSDRPRAQEDWYPLRFLVAPLMCLSRAYGVRPRDG
jgi:hypothetical protein